MRYLNCLILLVFIFMISGCNNDATPNSSASNIQQVVSQSKFDVDNTGATNTQINQSESSYKQGDPIKIGYFTYKIISVRKVKYLDTGFTLEKSDGVFWIVKLSVTNNDIETRMLDSSLFTIKTQNGDTYDPSQKGELRSDIIFLKQIQPGIPTKGDVIFEVPPALKTALLSLSGGFSQDSINVPITISYAEEYDDR